MFRSNFQEDKVAGGDSTKLQAVFSKLSGVLPRAEDLGNSNSKIMSSDIIESVLADTPVPVATNWNHRENANTQKGNKPSSNTNSTEPSTDTSTPEDNSAASTNSNDHCICTISALSKHLESALRAAKRSHLSCGEVLLPCGLLHNISRDIFSMSESEPCGLRGCKLYLLFETPEHCIRLGTVQCDLTTPSTFELYLTLKQSSNGWHFLPQFLRNLRRGGTIVVSPAYTLTKKKLYRSYKEE